MWNFDSKSKFRAAFSRCLHITSHKYQFQSSLRRPFRNVVPYVDDLENSSFKSPKFGNSDRNQFRDPKPNLQHIPVLIMSWNSYINPVTSCDISTVINLLNGTVEVACVIQRTIVMFTQRVLLQGYLSENVNQWKSKGGFYSGF